MNPWAQSFLTNLRASRNYSTHTLRAYSADIEEFLKRSGAATPQALDRGLIRGYIADLQRQGKLSRASVLRKISAVRSLTRYLREQGSLRRDPFVALPTPKREKRLPKFLTETEITTLLAQGARGAEKLGARDRAILETLYSSGLRRSEISGLNVGDVDFLSGFVRVFGKGSRERLVPIGSKALSCIREYLKTRGPRDGGHALFLNQRGGRLTHDGIALVVRRWARESGWPKPITPHVFRHSFATHLLNSGCDLRSVQDMLGHKNLATTEIYTHLSLEHLRKVYEGAHPKSASNEGRPS